VVSALQSAQYESVHLVHAFSPVLSANPGAQVLQSSAPFASMQPTETVTHVPSAFLRIGLPSVVDDLHWRQILSVWQIWQFASQVKVAHVPSSLRKEPELQAMHLPSGQRAQLAGQTVHVAASFG
jgi:hypothetical protein